MNRSNIALGIFLIALGAVVYTSLQPIISLQPVIKQTMASDVAVTIMAGSNVPRIFHLPNFARVTGTINTVSGGNKDINFYVFDKGNYNRWIDGLPNSHYIYIYRAADGASFTFSTDHDDDFYFVFDNPSGWPFGSDRFVNWSVSYEYKPYAPYALPMLILLVVAGSLLIAWQQVGRLWIWILKQRICPNCSKKISLKESVCPHCGFDVNKSIRCKYCKTLYDRSLQKCPNCGAHNN